MNTFDLSGTWALCLEPAPSFQPPRAYPDTIRLPDSTSHARKGKKSDERYSGHLTDPYAFEGTMWVRREIQILPEWEDKEIFLFLERTRLSSVFLDGALIGTGDSLCTPHRFSFPSLPAGRHLLEIGVRNMGYPVGGGHMTSPDTQTNWLGILGRIELQIRPRIRAEEIRVLSGTGPDKVVLSVRCTGNGALCCRVDDQPPVTFPAAAGNNLISVPVPEPLASWDEFSPALHTLTATLSGEEQTVSFGIRTLETRGRRILINGRETFLRGKHDGMIFPETGYAPMAAEDWLRVMGTARQHGINHYRFHTCCPPEAAFIAANQLGIYLEPELPFWGTVSEAETEETSYLREEGYRILREYGNHPSFFMLSMGNELWGSKKRLEEMLEGYHRADDRHLYTDGSNNYQMTPMILKHADVLCGVRLSRSRLYRGSYAMCDAPQGFVQTDVPNTAHCYDAVILDRGDSETGPAAGSLQVQVGTGVRRVQSAEAGITVPDIPVVSHEIGQYETYPDYREIATYTGVLKAENLALYREKAQARGLLPYADRFFRASGTLAAECYRLELEAAFKTEELSGFQLLDLQDFPGQGTALVGMLNAHMQSKGILSPAEWRRFCGPEVLMAALPRFVWGAEETFRADVLLSTTTPDFRAESVEYEIVSNEKTLCRGSLPVRTDHRVNRLGEIVWQPGPIKTPLVCQLHLRIPGTAICNSYRLAFYPKMDVTLTRERIVTPSGTVRIAEDQEEALRLQSAGMPVLWIPPADGKLEGTYCTNFWCYPMFRSISESMHKKVPVGTLGCLIETGHPALQGFPTETHSTPDWYHLVSHSHCEEVVQEDENPIVWVIDNPDRAKKLALLTERNTSSGPLLLCTVRLWEIPDQPEVPWFADALVRYAMRKRTD